MTKKQKDYIIKLVEKDMKVLEKDLDKEEDRLTKRIFDLDKKITELNSTRAREITALSEVQTQITERNLLVQALSDSIIVE